MAATPTDDLLERLKDPEYAKLYGEENAKVDFAITLTKARKSLNLTQRSLADKLNVSQPYVANLERGEANPTLGTIGRLLAAINLRFVTGTAPLKPEKKPSSAAFVPISAAGAVLHFPRARRPVEESQWAPPLYCGRPVNAGTATDWIPSESAQYPSRVTAVGGEAR